MSEENFETIRAAMDAWNHGEWDEALKHAAPNVEFDNSSNGGRVARSPQGTGIEVAVKTRLPIRSRRLPC